MATCTKTFGTAAQANAAYYPFWFAELGGDLVHAVTRAAAAYYEVGSVDVTTFNSQSATFVSGVLANGHTFEETGTNLLGDPSTISRLEFGTGLGNHVTLKGSIVREVADGPLTGAVTSATVKFGPAPMGSTTTTVTLTEHDDVASAGDAVITRATIVHNDADGNELGRLTFTGSLTVTHLFTDGIPFQTYLNGTVTGMSFTSGQDFLTITGMHASYDQLMHNSEFGNFEAWALTGNDLIMGSTAGDELWGEAGNDTMHGYAGADVLVGSAGADHLYGEASGDTLNGSFGHDVLVGGAGSDVFVLDSRKAADSDRFSDFNPAEDTIWLENNFIPVGANGTPLAQAKYCERADVDEAGATTSGQRILYDTDSGNLYYDPDGSGFKAKILIAQLTGHPDISAADFLVV